MNADRLYRQSGYALAGAGLLTGAGMLLHPDITNPHAAMDPLWVPSHLVILVGLLLATFGLTGMFLRQARQAGWPATVGFVLLQAGVALTVVAIATEAFVLPPVAASAAGAALLDPAGPLLGGVLGVLLLGAIATYILGTLVFGAAALAAGVFPRPALALLMVGGALVPLDSFLPQLIVRIGAILLAISFVWLGLRLVGPAAAEVAPEPAAA
jgi:hypothetical protein